MVRVGGSIPPLGTKQNLIIMKKDKFDSGLNAEYVRFNQKKKAKKALQKAKELEKTKDKKPVRLNSKTIVLR